MMVEPLLLDLARAVLVEREVEAQRFASGSEGPRPLMAPLARWLVRLGLALDPGLRRELAEGAPQSPLRPAQLP